MQHHGEHHFARSPRKLQRITRNVSSKSLYRSGAEFLPPSVVWTRAGQKCHVPASPPVRLVMLFGCCGRCARDRSQGGYFYNVLTLTFGCRKQNQLGHGLFGRRFMECLNPHPIEIRHAKYIASGEYYSFAVNEKDNMNMWAWGLNSFDQGGWQRLGAPAVSDENPRSLRRGCGMAGRWAPPLGSGNSRRAVLCVGPVGRRAAGHRLQP